MSTRIIPPIPESIWKNPLHFIAFGFGTGALPIAPGTFGTLIAIPFYLVFQSLSPIAYLIMLIFVIIASSWISDRFSRELGVHDHQGMCLDEIVGFLVTMFCVPHGLIWIIMGFLLFRLFDIWKPWPIGYADKHVHGGFGMILDDVLAGIASCVILQLLARVFL